MELEDGTPVLLRPVTPEDRERLVVGMAQLSAGSRYFRFFTPLPRLAEEQLRYFTEVAPPSSTPFPEWVGPAHL